MTATSGHDPTTGELIARLSTEVRELVRDELQLAKVEMTDKARDTGLGVGMFGAAGLIALYGVGVLVATAILALALVLDAWLAALIVGVVLLAVAGVAALLGRGRVRKAAPLAPAGTTDSVKQDVETVRRAAHRGTK